MIFRHDNRCVCCGEVIPEGRQVCPSCEYKAEEVNADDSCPDRIRAIQRDADAVHLVDA